MTTETEASPAPRLEAFPQARSLSAACLRGALATVIAVLAVVVGGLAALLLALSVPNSRVADQINAAVNSHVWGPNYPGDGFGGSLDRYTECIGWTLGLEAPRLHRGPLERAVLSPYLGQCETSASSVQAIQRHRDGLVKSDDYYRYWHGYAALTRPVIGAFGVAGGRLVVGALLLSSLGAFYVAMCGTVGRWAGVAILTPLVAASNLLALEMAVTQAVAIIGVFATASLVLWLARRKGLAAVSWSSALAGGVFSYLDLLTTPALSWALTAAAAAIGVWAHRHSLRVTALGALLATGTWMFGYAATWVAKWVLAALYVGPQKVKESILSIGQYRLNGNQGTVVNHAFGSAIRANYHYWTDHISTATPLLVASAAALGVMLSLAWMRGRGRALVLVAVLASPAALVLAWYELLSNHSQIHTFFTYRSLPAGVGVVLAAAAVAAFSPREWLVKGQPQLVPADRTVSVNG